MQVDKRNAERRAVTYSPVPVPANRRGIAVSRVRGTQKQCTRAAAAVGDFREQGGGIEWDGIQEGGKRWDWMGVARMAQWDGMPRGEVAFDSVGCRIPPVHCVWSSVL